MNGAHRGRAFARGTVGWRLVVLLGAVLSGAVLSCGGGEDPPADALSLDGSDSADSAGDSAGDATAVPICGALDADAPMAVGAWLVTWRPGDPAADDTAAGSRWELASEGAGESAAPMEVIRLGPPRRTAEPPVYENLFGAFRFRWLDGSVAPSPWHAQPGPTWSGAGAPSAVCVAADGRAAWAEYDGGGVLRWSAEEDGSLRVAWDAGVDGAELRWECGADESFFGLGSQSVGMDLRGRRYPLWSQEQGIGKPADGGIFPINNYPEAAYAPMGVLHSTRGWSALVAHDAFAELELCADRGWVRFGSYRAPAELVLQRADTPAEQVGWVTSRVGRMASAAPAWWFGPWNDAVGGPERLREVAQTLRAQDIPSSAMWTEDWIGGEQGAFGFMLSYAWEWDPLRYPDLPGDVEWLHDLGFAFLGYFNPFVPDTTRMWDEGVEGDYLVRLLSGERFEFDDPGFRNAGLVDLTNPGARDWLAGYLERAVLDVGLDGWMADFAEWLPVDARMHDQSEGWDAHNRYPVQWQALNREVMERLHAGDEARDWVFFSRSGWATEAGGTPGVASVLWAGDQETNWLEDDGIPTVVSIGVHAGLSGVPMFGSDIAGYSSYGTGHTSKELFFRWTTLGALTPVMRTHHGSSECANWQFDRDPATLAHYRRWASIHTLLYPQWLALAAEARETGLPIMRHPWLVEPEVAALWQDQRAYFLGRDLLVVPVLTRSSPDATAVPLAATLPAEGWWPWFADAPVNAPGWQGDIEPTEVAVFVRPGTGLALSGAAVHTAFEGAPVNPAAFEGGALPDGFQTLVESARSYRVALYPHADGSTRPTAVGGWTVELAGWHASDGGAAWELTAGAPLAPCNADVSVPSEVDAPCIDAWGAVHVDVGAAESLGLRRGAARVQITAVDGAAHSGGSNTGEPVRLIVGIARQAWGPWAEATEVGDLDAENHPPCERE